MPDHYANFKPGSSVDPPLEEKKASPVTESTRPLLDFTPVPKKDVPPIWEFPPNDDGHGGYLLAHFGEFLRFVPVLNVWRIWHGHKWHTDDSRRVHNYLQILSRHAQASLKDFRKSLLESDDKLTPKDIARQYDAARAAAMALGDERKMSATMAAASCSPSVIVPVAAWDADDFLLGTQNGVIDLKKIVHRPSRPEDYITKEIAVSFDADAKCPLWEKFMTRILDLELGGYIQRLSGYTLTGDISDQAFYFLYGSGKNGKTTLIETLSRLMGDYQMAASKNMLEEPWNGDGCKHALAQLPGSRFLHGNETSEGGKFREDLIKEITGGDTLTGEAKFCAPFTFRAKCKIWISGNNKPIVQGTDFGMWRRMRLIPFLAVITTEETDPQLPAKLAQEFPGILNWMLQGLREYYTRGLLPPAAVMDAVEEYRADQDILGDFISECIRGARDDYEETKAEIFKRFQEWESENGIRAKWSNKQLTRRLKAQKGWRMNPSKDKWIGVSVIPRDS